MSRLKLREAIAKGVVPARRDNEGRWRADLSGLPADLAAALRDRPAAPEALIEALFDEIEELAAERAMALAERASAALAAAQAEAAALEDGLTAKTAALEGQARLLDRLFSLSETALETAGKAAAPRGLWDRVLGRK